MNSAHGYNGTSGGQGELRTVSKSGFAKLVGLTPGRISQLISQGLPVEPDGKVDVARGKLWIAGNVDPVRAAAQANSEQGQLFQDERPTALTAEKTRLARAQADAAEVRNLMLRAELLKAGDVEKEWSAMLRTVRAGLLAIPARLQQQLPHISAADIAVFDAELRAALEQLADDNSKGAK